MRLRSMALSIQCSATRSFMLPVGFADSSFKKRCLSRRALSFGRATKGVSWTAFRMDGSLMVAFGRFRTISAVPQTRLKVERRLLLRFTFNISSAIFRLTLPFPAGRIYGSSAAGTGLRTGNIASSNPSPEVAPEPCLSLTVHSTLYFADT